MAEEKKKIYIPICEEWDPEVENSARKTILGAFSTPELANESFTKEEEVISKKDGETWTRKHICFRGEHTVKEFVVDQWYPLG